MKRSNLIVCAGVCVLLGTLVSWAGDSPDKSASAKKAAQAKAPAPAQIEGKEGTGESRPPHAQGGYVPRRR